jgi:hypothetical protein
MGDGWDDYAYKTYRSYVDNGTSVTGGSTTFTTTTTTGDYTVWTDGSPYYEAPDGPSEYTFEEGVLKYKDPKTYEWRKIEELELESDPFPLEIREEKKKAKIKQTKRTKIKLNKKLGVDMEEIAEELF